MKPIIDIVSPSMACSLTELDQIKQYLFGFNLCSNIFIEHKNNLDSKISGYGNIEFSGEFAAINPDTRFEQFRLAVENNNSQIIWCSRGGYGCAEIIPFLRQMPKPKYKKMVIGFSDITSLGIFLNQEWGWPLIQAPTLMQIINNQVLESSKQAILDLVLTQKADFCYQVESINIDNNHKIEAQIVGGCISVISGNFGTKNQINWQDKILFLEDEGEAGERLDRYFYQITSIIKENNQKPKAILLGNFSQSNSHGSPQDQEIQIAIKRLIMRNQDIPIFIEKNGCLGHSKNMMPLITGHEARIYKNSLTQSFDLTK